MIDTYIVAYAEDLNLSFDDLYPYQLPFPYVSKLITYTPNSQTEGYKTAEVIWSYYKLNPTQGKWSDSVVSKYGLIDNTVYAYCASYYDGTYLNLQSVSNSPGICYYGLVDGVSGDGLYFQTVNTIQSKTLLRLTSQDVINSGITYNPWQYSDISFDGDILSFCYNLGGYLSDSISSIVYDLLNFNINGVSFISLFTTTSIFLYVGWVLVKWVI